MKKELSDILSKSEKVKRFFDDWGEKKIEECNQNGHKGESIISIDYVPEARIIAECNYCRLHYSRKLKEEEHRLLKMDAGNDYH